MARRATNLTLTAGLRVDVAAFERHRLRQPERRRADLPRRDRRSRSSTTPASCRTRTPLWSPRVGFNWDVGGNSNTQVRGGTGVFTGKPAYVWISNQIGNTGVLTGFDPGRQHDARSRSRPTPRHVQADHRHRRAGGERTSWPSPTRTSSSRRSGAPTSPSTGGCRGASSGTAEYIYNQDVNGMYYINANLPAAQTTFTGADTRPRWVGTSCTAPTAGRCVTRINNAAGNQITNAIVLTELRTSDGRGTSPAASTKNLQAGLSVKAAYSYGESKNTIDPGLHRRPARSPATPSSTTRTTRSSAYSASSPGHRVVHQRHATRRASSASARRAVSAFWERVHQRQHQLRVLRRHERRLRVRQRPDLHPA